jgi:hypothetical protein
MILYILKENVFKALLYILKENVFKAITIMLAYQVGNDLKNGKQGS